MKSLIILVDAAAFAVAGVQVDVAYYQPINDYLKNNVFTIRDRSQVSVTGHSLGGGLAAIVAGKNSIRAVSVSAPGVLFTSKAISLDNDVVRRMWITITSENDIVPTFDQTVTLATIFSIKCLKSEVGCHLIPGTLCELMKGCGDVYNRGVKSEDCDADTV
jgi:putative lipase involved disintegration of autophagic bodies